MQPNRRKVLTVLGAAGLSSIAGCNSPSGGSTSNEAPDHEAAWPQVKSDVMIRYTETNRRQSSQTHTKWYFFDVHSYERTIIYENTALRAAVRQKTLGQFDSTLAMFFATHIDLEGNGTIGASNERIAEIAIPTFESQLEESEIQAAHQVSPGNPLPNLGDALIYEYRGEYTAPRITREVPLGGELGTRTLVIEESQLPITGFVAIWKDGTGTAFVGGGAFPADDFDKSSTISVTSEEGDGIDVTVTVDLNMQPQQIRRNMVDLIESIEKSDEKA